MQAAHRDESFGRAILHIKQAAERGDLHQAQEEAALACALWPQRAEAWLWRAWLCDAPEEALTHAQQAARLEPSEITAQAVRWAEARLQRTTPDPSLRSGQARQQTTDDGPQTADGGRRTIWWARKEFVTRHLLFQRVAAQAGLYYEWAKAQRFQVRPVQLVSIVGAAAILLFMWIGGGVGPARASGAKPLAARTVSIKTAQVQTLAEAKPADAPKPGRAVPQTSPSRYVLNRPTLAAPPLSQLASLAAVLNALPISRQPSAEPPITFAMPAPLDPAEVDARLFGADLLDESAVVATDTVATGAGTAVISTTLVTAAVPTDTAAYALWPARNDPVPYQVQTGENPTTIAQKFGLDLSTIIWANGTLEENPELLSVGQTLLIPALDGVLHTVKEGDTLNSLATLYKVDVSLIVWFPGNGLSSADAPLQVGQNIMVPGGRKPYVAPPAAPAPPQRVAQQSTSTSNRGYFAWPTGGAISQASHAYHVALDIAAPMNTPIYASAGGTIVYSGWDDSGYGYTILIDHGNRWRTRYAHLSGMYFEVGDWVNQGELIALMGSTGRSTGPHLHFEILYNGWRYNPYDYLSR